MWVHTAHGRSIDVTEKHTGDTSSKQVKDLEAEGKEVVATAPSTYTVQPGDPSESPHGTWEDAEARIEAETKEYRDAKNEKTEEDLSGESASEAKTAEKTKQG